MPKTVVLSQWMLLFEMFLVRVTFVILINIYRERVSSCLRAQEIKCVLCVCVLCACFIPGTSYLDATDNRVAKMDIDSLITTYSYNEAVHQLFIVFKKAYDSVRRESCIIFPLSLVSP